MTLSELFEEAPDFISGMTSSFSKIIPSLIIIFILIGIIYWIKSLQKQPSTEIRVYRRP